VSPEEFKTYQEGLVRACEKLQRDPATLQHRVNLHFHMGADEAGARVAREKLQKFPPGQRLGALAGTAPEVIDRVAEYMKAGVNGLNIAFRPPIDWDAFEAYIERVLPVFQ
jgi:alkanesulfonate monooxygenase SsuD/methylene tetrahydromethanopterin reductase-like flavin-dependent oxidoreductase (luciferase family)